MLLDDANIVDHLATFSDGLSYEKSLKEHGQFTWKCILGLEF